MTVVADKKAVPVDVYANLLQVALDPPTELLSLPIASEQDEPVDMWVSLLLRPIVRPEVEGVLPEKSLETRFFAPGTQTWILSRQFLATAAIHFYRKTMLRWTSITGPATAAASFWHRI